MTQNIVKDLLQANVDWFSTDTPYTFSAKFGETLCALRFNDFPDEPPYTVIVNGIARDVDEFPSGWRLPGDRGQA